MEDSFSSPQTYKNTQNVAIYTNSEFWVTILSDVCNILGL